jgi:hypothetical protein
MLYSPRPMFDWLSIIETCPLPEPSPPMLGED